MVVEYEPKLCLNGGLKFRGEVVGQIRCVSGNPTECQETWNHKAQKSILLALLLK